MRDGSTAAGVKASLSWPQLQRLYHLAGFLEQDGDAEVECLFVGDELGFVLFQNRLIVSEHVDVGADIAQIIGDLEDLALRTGDRIVEVGDRIVLLLVVRGDTRESPRGA